VVGYIALFFALTGTAWALQANSVRSGHVKDNNLKSVDLKDNNLKSVDLKDNNLKSVDLKDGQGVDGADVINESLGSSDIAGLSSGDVSNNSLTGDDIVEGSLGQVPAAAIGGTARFGEGGCSPGTAIADCAVVTNVSSSQPHRVLLMGRTRGIGAGGTGSCHLLGSVTGAISGTTVSTTAGAHHFPLVGITGPLSANFGQDYGIGCNENGGEIVYTEGDLVALVISPD